MRVSVIITTRNRATELRRTCDVVMQLRPAPNEVLVTADGCTDGTVDILADAAYYILSKPSDRCTGNTFIDEDVLAGEGITDLDKYSVVPGAQLYKDLFV